MDALAAAQAAAEAAMYETASQEMAEQQQYQQQQQQHHEMLAYAEQQERGYLESLQQNSDQLGGVQTNLIQDFLGSSSGKDQSTNELLHLLAQQQGQQSGMEQPFEPDDSMNLRPQEHYMTIAHDGKFNSAEQICTAANSFFLKFDFVCCSRP